MTKVYFDESSYQKEVAQLQQVRDQCNNLLQACEAFNFNFQDIGDFKEFVSKIERHKERAVLDRVYEALEPAQVGGFQIKREAMMQQLDLPDPKPVVQAHSGIRSITRGNFALIFWLILVDGEIKLPKASLEQLQEQHTVRANTKEQANFMAKLEQAAKSVSELKEAANKLGSPLCDPNKVDLTSFVKHGWVDAEAWYLIKRIQRQG
jgi:HD superfamily phosphohydrolase